MLRRLLGPALFTRFKAGVRSAQNRLTGETFALHNLDTQLVEIIGPSPGFFVEVGAGDGLDQSNTLLLERRYGWTGLLVEPIQRQYELCCRYRKGSVVRNCLLTSPQLSGRGLTIVDYGLQSYVTDESAMSALSKSERDDRLAAARSERLGAYHSIHSTTLSELLDDLRIARVDLLSVDVEGNELDVIAGIDFDRHEVRFLLVETGQPGEVERSLGASFEMLARLSIHDYLFRSSRDNRIFR